MAHWLMQLTLLAVFALVSASVEYRRTGLILAGFAAFYLALTHFNGVMDDISPPLYALLYAVMDYAAARLVFMYGSKGRTVQVVLLCAFVLTHIMAWAYTLGLYSPLDPQRYVVVTMTLAGLQIIAISPGIKDGAHEIMDMVQKTLAGRRLRTQHYRDSHSQPVPLQDRLQSIRRRSSVNSVGSGVAVPDSSSMDRGQAGGDIQ